MKIAVIYHSRGGNTKIVAEAIAKAAGVSAEPIHVPLDAPVDLLLIGGGVYGLHCCSKN
jgi:flavodoxin